MSPVPINNDSDECCEQEVANAGNLSADLKEPLIVAREESLNTSNRYKRNKEK